MTRWVCPDCGRTFGRTRQGHECAPAMSMEEYLATAPPHEGPVVEALLPHLTALGDDVVIEPVSVGVLVKRRRTFAELRPMVRWESVSFGLDRDLNRARISRRQKGSSGMRWYGVNVRTPDEVDDELRGWIAEAYDLG